MKLNLDKSYELIDKWAKEECYDMSLLNFYFNRFLAWIYDQGYLIVKKERRSDNDG